LKTRNIRCVSFNTSKFIALEEANNCTLLLLALVLVAEKYLHLMQHRLKLMLGLIHLKHLKIKGFSRYIGLNALLAALMVKLSTYKGIEFHQ
jgi:hypothetical protein